MMRNSQRNRMGSTFVSVFCQRGSAFPTPELSNSICPPTEPGVYRLNQPVKFVLIRGLFFGSALMNGKSLFAKADGFGSHFDQFILVDEFERLFERKVPEWNQADGLVGR